MYRWNQSAYILAGVSSPYGRYGLKAGVAPAAERCPGRPAELRDAEAPRDVELVVRVLHEGHETVHVGRREPRIGDRGVDRLHRELELTATRVLRELGLADAGDRRGRGCDHDV